MFLLFFLKLSLYQFVECFVVVFVMQSLALNIILLLLLMLLWLLLLFVYISREFLGELCLQGRSSAVGMIACVDGSLIT